MAYDKYTWQTGEVITQEKLNHMEQGIEDGVNGYECTETTEVLFDETISSSGSDPVYMAVLAYSLPIMADTLIITFDGVEYTCPRQSSASGMSVYGAPASLPADYSQFPFTLSSANGTQNFIYTQTAGEHTIKGVAVSLDVTTTNCFNKAVQSVEIDNAYIISTSRDSGGNTTVDRTYQEIHAAIASGKFASVDGDHPYQGENSNGDLVFASYSIEEDSSAEQAKLKVTQYRIDYNNSVTFLAGFYSLTKAYDN